MKHFSTQLSNKTYEKLKDYAKESRRSLRNYIELWLDYLASQEYKEPPTASIYPEMLEYYSISEQEEQEEQEKSEGDE